MGRRQRQKSGISYGSLSNFWKICLIFLPLLTAPAWALNVAVPYVKADFMWAQGYQGDGVELGVIDLQLGDMNHPAIDDNYLGFEKTVNGAGWIGAHATLVTGTAVSQDPTYTGVAPQAGWWAMQTTNRGGITSQRKQTTAAETLAQGLGNLGGNPVEVITMSIGLGGSSSATDQWSLALDHITNTNGRTITVAAGNDGPSSSSLNGLPTGAFNAIIVGATGDTGGSASQDYSNVASYSSRGPTADGRTKPDIVAPGSLIHAPTLNSAWGDFNGTSLATPMVAGGASLLIDMGLDLGYSTDPKVIKSVLLNSADKLSGWSHTSTQPLDFSQGTGQMNLEKAYQQYIIGEQNPGTVSDVGWDRELITGVSENLYDINGIVSAGESITATLAWDRIVTTDSEDIDKVIYSFDHLDNLDLFLYEASDLSTPLANSTSTIDNLEHIYYSAISAGSYVLGVKMTGALPADLETYGLAWSTVAQIPALLGDVDGDGFVGGDDLSIVLTNWGLSGLAREGGDLSGDGFVGGDDYSKVLSFWGTGTPPQAIPEPAALGLFAIVGLFLWLHSLGVGLTKFDS